MTTEVQQKETVPFTKEDVKHYLDSSTRFWRQCDEDFAEYYVDAFQSVRMSLFGELLPIDNEQGQVGKEEV